MIDGEGRRHAVEQGADHADGQHRVGETGFPRREGTGEQARADQEMLLVLVVAGEVQHLLDRRPARQRATDPRGHRVFVEANLDLAGDGEVEQVRMLADGLGEARSATEDLAEERA